MNLELKNFNPWKYQLGSKWFMDLWKMKFLYFCCPTCDLKKDKSKDDFIKYAMVEHANTKEAFLYEINK